MIPLYSEFETSMNARLAEVTVLSCALTPLEATHVVVTLVIHLVQIV